MVLRVISIVTFTTLLYGTGDRDDLDRVRIGEPKCYYFINTNVSLYVIDLILMCITYRTMNLNNLKTYSNLTNCVGLFFIIWAFVGMKVCWTDRF